MIGIRQADGSFYEILGDAQSGHKRLVLSAARTDQHGVRIELFRSTDGRLDDAAALGSISLDDPDGLGYQDIEFRVDLDAEGQLEASAALPGQPPRKLSVDLTPFRNSEDALPAMDFDDLGSESMTLDLPDDEEAPRRTDSDILGDDAFATADLDTLDDAFDLAEPEPEAEAEPEAPRRTDNDILGDDAFATADLDTLDDFSLDDLGESPEAKGLDSFDVPDDADALELSEPSDDLATPSFDLGDLDAGFGEAEPAAEPEVATNPAEDWEKISLDDMEPMEFLDTGAEISAPSAQKAPAGNNESFAMDDEPLELGDFDSDLSDLPDFGDSTPKAAADSSSEADFDQDFLPPPSLTEPAPWEVDEAPVSEAPTVGRPSKTKAPKAAKSSKPAIRPAPSTGDGLDKMSLVLSLAALSLLVLLILVLLFLNMVKAPQPPVIQPEVQRWKETTSLASTARPRQAVSYDLNDAPSLEAQSVLEVPDELRGAKVSMVLAQGDSVADAAKRFGAPARVQGNLLSW